MTKREALNIIYNNLQKGNYYYSKIEVKEEDKARLFTAEELKSGKDYIVSEVLSCDYFLDNILWTNYGHSATKNTKTDLKWIIEVIFKTTPQKFIDTYFLMEA